MPQKKILKSQADRKFHKGIEAALVDLDLKWCVLMHLFSSEDNLKLLNETASSFFQLVQELLISDIVMGISRLMDPPTTGGKNSGKDNLSMKGFSTRIADPNTKTAYDSIIDGIASQLRDLSTWRHKKLAHNDLKKARRLVQLPDLYIDNLDHLISLLFSAFNKVVEAQQTFHTLGTWCISRGELLRFCDT